MRRRAYLPGTAQDLRRNHASAPGADRRFPKGTGNEGRRADRESCGWRSDQGASELLNLNGSRLRRFPAALEQIHRSAAIELRALPRKPLTNSEFVVGSREVTDNQSQKVQALRDIVRRNASVRPVSPNADGRHSEEPG